MAISSVNTSAWTEITTDLATVTIPATPAAGDRMFLFVTWKDFARTLTVSGWTSCGAAFADGSVASGVSTGSMKVQAFYRDWQSGDANPVLDWDATTNLLAGAIVRILRKAADEVWATPIIATAAWPVTAVTQTISASATTAVPSGAMVQGLIGLRNDSATFTRAATTGIDVSSGITWNGNYTESPATHRSSVTGNDGAADAGLRLVTTGGTVTLRQTATISAVETGAILWVTQGVNIAVTPTPFSTAWTGFGPTVTVSDNKSVTPDPFSTAWTGFDPTVTVSSGSSVTVTPTPFSTAWTGFAPTVTASDNKSVTPTPFALLWTGFASTVTATNNQSVTPNPFAIAWAGFAPDVTATGGVVPSRLQTPIGSRRGRPVTVRPYG